MNTSIISEFDKIVKWVVPIDPTTDLTNIPDNVYPFNGPSTGSGCTDDKWAVVINERQVGWSPAYGVACTQYIEALRVKREHAQRCPGDIPFDGIAPTTAEDRIDDYAIEPVTP